MSASDEWRADWWPTSDPPGEPEVTWLERGPIGRILDRHGNTYRTVFADRPAIGFTKEHA